MAAKLTNAQIAGRFIAEALIGQMVDAHKAERDRRIAVMLEVVAEGALLRWQTELVQRVAEDSLFGLTHPDIAGDDHDIKHAVEDVLRVGIAPGVAQQRRLNSRSLCPANEPGHVMRMGEVGE